MIYNLEKSLMNETFSVNFDIVRSSFLKNCYKVILIQGGSKNIQSCKKFPGLKKKKNVPKKIRFDPLNLHENL